MPEVGNAIQTTHNLDFEAAYWNHPANGQGWQLFRIGTCNGQWRHTPKAYEILSVVNDIPNNGHFQDVLQWFEFACKREKIPLLIREVCNLRFKKHLITKQGFEIYGSYDVIKHFEE